MSQQNTRFIHLRRRNQDNSLARTGGITVAYRTTADSIEVGFSIVSRQDIYDRKKGREQALKNLENEGSPYGINIVNAVAINKAASVLSQAASTGASRVLTDFTKQALIGDLSTSLALHIMNKGSADRVLGTALIEHVVVERVFDKCRDFEAAKVLPKNLTF